jgi:hypothetical protein
MPDENLIAVETTDFHHIFDPWGDVNSRFMRVAVIWTLRSILALRAPELLLAAPCTKARNGPLRSNGPKAYISIASAIAKASSNSTPRHFTVLFILVWPDKSRTARKLPVFL